MTLVTAELAQANSEISLRVLLSICRPKALCSKLCEVSGSTACLFLWLRGGAAVDLGAPQTVSPCASSITESQGLG